MTGGVQNMRPIEMIATCCEVKPEGLNTVSSNLSKNLDTTLLRTLFYKYRQLARGRKAATMERKAERPLSCAFQQ